LKKINYVLEFYKDSAPN